MSDHETTHEHEGDPAAGHHATPLLDQLENGPWPSFVKGLKRLAQREGRPRRHDEESARPAGAHLRDPQGLLEGGRSVFGYGAGVIPRFSEVAAKYPASEEFHTMRIQPPAGYHLHTKTLRQLCDIWEKHGSGLIALHGQSGDIMFQGCRTEQVQPAWDEFNAMGFDMGGAGAGVRTSAACVGPARCEQSCFDKLRAMKTVIDDFTDDIHRPALPYKMKFKFSGCANDCSNATQRADVAVFGTWRDDMQVNQDEIKAKVAKRAARNSSTR